MSNWIDCTLDVLATDPKEINDLARTLREPSRESLISLLTDFDTPPADDEEIDRLRELVAFQAVRNLGYVHESVNKSRRFEKSFKSNVQGLIDAHLCQVSSAFPNATFLAHYADMQWSCAWKEVVRNGVVERSVWDGNQRAQAIDWMLPDIFAPFRAEYETAKPFGSMWSEWVDALIAAADGLRDSPRSASDYKKEKQHAESAAQRTVEEWLSKS
jgi:hypothetical protein